MRFAIAVCLYSNTDGIHTNRNNAVNRWEQLNANGVYMNGSNSNAREKTGRIGREAEIRNRS